MINRIIYCAALITSFAIQTVQAESLANNIVGVWQLVEFNAVSVSGKKIYPFGEDAFGRIIYTKGGYMAVSLSHHTRENISGSGPAVGGPADEIQKAYATFDAYSGKYEVNEQELRVYHHVDIDRVPNYMGITKIRSVKFEDSEPQRITLSSVENMEAYGDSWQLNLIWERIE